MVGQPSPDAKALYNANYGIAIQISFRYDTIRNTLHFAIASIHSHDTDTGRNMARIRVIYLEESSNLEEDIYDARDHSSVGRIAQKTTAELKQHFNCTRRSSRGRRPMGKLLFYRLVKGGNVAAVAKVLDDLKVNDPFLHTVVLLGETEANLQSQNPNCLLNCNNCLALSAIYLLILLPICILLTPIFYIVHSWTHSASSQQAISRDVKLPLLFAALSSDVDVVRLFLERHSNILKASDESECNVFHYLADLSR